MLRFETPEPVHVVIDVLGATVSLLTGEPGATTVDLRPHTTRSADVEFAKATTVDFSGGRLTIRSPRGKRSRWRTYFFGGGDRVDLNIVPGGIPGDFERLGVEIDHAGRYEQAEELMQACRALWTGERTDFTGTSITLRGAR